MVGLEALLPNTKSVLLQLSKSVLLQDFTFVGGSAIAVHLDHRLSEDIDLFSWNKELDVAKIQNTLSSYRFEEIRTITLNKLQCNYMINGVKVSFFANNWEELKDAQPLVGNIKIAHLNLLCVMKINTLFLRAKFRDYYDLYTMNLHSYPLEKMYDLAAPKLNNLNKTLFQKALIYIDDIQDENIGHLNPKYDVSLQHISEHFSQEIKKWNLNL